MAVHAAQDPTADRVYFGHIGKADAVLCIGGDQKTGRYFYQKSGVDIPLQVQVKERDSFVFKETPDEENEDKDAVTWTVKSSNRRLSGKLVNPANGRSFPVEFTLEQELRDSDESKTPLSCADSSNFEKGRNNSYVQAKVTRPVKVIRVLGKGGIKVEQVVEPVSETEWIQIAEHPDPKAKGRLNSLLRFQLQSKIFRSLDCRSNTNLTGRPPGSIEQQFAIRFFTQNILSVEERIFGDCGGAHPFGGLTGQTFDLKSRKPIRADRIFRSAYFDKKSEYQGFTNKFRDVLSRYFSGSNKEEDRQMVSCFNSGLYFDAWLDAGGVWFSEGDYRLHECGEPFFVPYSTLQETLKDDVARLAGLIPKK